MDQIENIKTNIEIVNSSEIGLYFKPSLDKFTWKANKVSSLSFGNQKKFDNLNELNKFKDAIAKLESKLKTNIKINANYNLNTLTCSLTCIFYGASK